MPDANWGRVASSADSSKLFATEGSKIWKLDDSGATWTVTFDHGGGWTDITTSSDGSKVAACHTGGNCGYLYTSADYGATWSRSMSGIGTAKCFRDIASSADGSRLAMRVAHPSRSTIYTSADSGTTWSNTHLSDAGQMALSANGMIIFSLGSDGKIWKSDDSGQTWNVAYVRTWNISSSWTGVTTSSDGSNVAACYDGDSGGYVYTSANDGATWARWSDAAKDFIGITSSGDGSTIWVLTGTGGHMWSSTNGGGTWSVRQSPPGGSAITSSADGT